MHNNHTRSGHTSSGRRRKLRRVAALVAASMITVGLAGVVTGVTAAPASASTWPSSFPSSTLFPYFSTYGEGQKAIGAGWFGAYVSSNKAVYGYCIDPGGASPPEDTNSSTPFNIHYGSPRTIVTGTYGELSVAMWLGQRFTNSGAMGMSANELTANVANTTYRDFGGTGSFALTDVPDSNYTNFVKDFQAPWTLHIGLGPEPTYGWVQGVNYTGSVWITRKDGTTIPVQPYSLSGFGAVSLSGTSGVVLSGGWSNFPGGVQNFTWRLPVNGQASTGVTVTANAAGLAPTDNTYYTSPSGGGYQDMIVSKTVSASAGSGQVNVYAPVNPSVSTSAATTGDSSYDTITRSGDLRGLEGSVTWALNGPAAPLNGACVGDTTNLADATTVASNTYDPTGAFSNGSSTAETRTSALPLVPGTPQCWGYRVTWSVDGKTAYSSFGAAGESFFAQLPTLGAQAENSSGGSLAPVSYTVQPGTAVEDALTHTGGYGISGTQSLTWALYGPVDMPAGTSSCSSVTPSQYSSAGEASGGSFAPTGDGTNTTYATTLSGGSSTNPDACYSYEATYTTTFGSATVPLATTKNTILVQPIKVAPPPNSVSWYPT